MDKLVKKMRKIVESSGKTKIRNMAAVFLLVFTSVFIWNQLNPNIKEFRGKVVGVQGSIVMMEGYFIKNNSKTQELKEVIVIITPETELNKTTIVGDIGADPNKLDPSYLTANKKSCTLDGFTRDISKSVKDVVVISRENIFNKYKFEAAEIDFTVQE